MLDFDRHRDLQYRKLLRRWNRVFLKVRLQRDKHLAAQAIEVVLDDVDLLDSGVSHFDEVLRVEWASSPAVQNGRAASIVLNVDISRSCVERAQRGSPHR